MRVFVVFLCVLLLVCVVFVCCDMFGVCCLVLSVAVCCDVLCCDAWCLLRVVVRVRSYPLRRAAFALRCVRVILCWSVSVVLCCCVCCVRVVVSLLVDRVGSML